MRVISGIYKSRLLKGFNLEGTRPTMDNVKESMFGMIQNYINNSICLDLFSGSGSLGIEALSNGASKVYFVDNNKNIFKVLKENISNLNIENAELFNLEFEAAIKHFNKFNILFDLVLLDPPYNKNLINLSLIKLNEFEVLKDGAIVVCEYEGKKIIEYPNYRLLKHKNYGNKCIDIYVYEKNVV